MSCAGIDSRFYSPPLALDSVSDRLHLSGIASAQEDPGAFAGKGPRDGAADGTADSATASVDHSILVRKPHDILSQL
jgi:hypothetical protein